ARGDGVQHRLLADRRVRHLEHAEALQGHLHAVVQLHSLDLVHDNFLLKKYRCYEVLWRIVPVHPGTSHMGKNYKWIFTLLSCRAVQKLWWSIISLWPISIPAMLSSSFSDSSKSKTSRFSVIRS